VSGATGPSGAAGASAGPGRSIGTAASQCRHPIPDTSIRGYGCGPRLVRTAAEADFRDRYVKLGLTFGGAGVIRGDLTPECAAAVNAVVEALGKRRGPQDDRNEGQRFHDALAEACAPLPRARGLETSGSWEPGSQYRGLPGPRTGHNYDRSV